MLLSRPVRAQVPPDESWRSIETQHFRVTFPERLEALGRRAADRAEEAYVELSAAFIEPPNGPIDLLVTDHADVSNGFAQVTPSNRIVIYARPPVDDPGLGHIDEWLELVITHELAHIVQLDHTQNPIGKLARNIFGRVAAPWPFFPGSGTPRWITEGLATWYESSLTEAGRVRGTFYEMILRTAALEGRLESIGQTQGESPEWPAGARPYAYGSLFFDHLTDKYGANLMGVFTKAIAGQWIPYRINAAGRSAFGSSLSEEWSLWTEGIRSRITGLDSQLEEYGPITTPERLTAGGRWALRPKVSPDGRWLLYARSDGRSDSQLAFSLIDGAGTREFTRTNGLATYDWTPEGSVVLAQLEYADRYRLFDDLYEAQADGSTRRITKGARLTDPSVSPDGSWAIAVSGGGGTNGLALIDLESGEVTDFVNSDPDSHWAFPSISPNGRWIAATRWKTGALHDVVVLDGNGLIVAEITNDRAIDLAPEWSSDGSYLLWASDRTGILNILAVSFDPELARTGPPLLLTNVRTGALYPSVDPSGRWLYFSGYHADGWDIERVPFDPEAAVTAPPANTRFNRLLEEPEPPSLYQGDVQKYSAGSTLAPRYWEPLYSEAVRTPAIRTEDLYIRSRQLLGPAIGIQTSGIDLVGRHEWKASARVFTSGSRADAGFRYTYSGLGNPRLSISANNRWGRGKNSALVTQRANDALLDTLFVLKRDRSLNASAQFQHRKWRNSLFVTLSAGMLWEKLELLNNSLEPENNYRLNRPRNRMSDLSIALSYSTARSHAYQVGGSEGVVLFARARTRRSLSLPDSLVGLSGLDSSVDELIGRARVYVPLGITGHAPHVLALQTSFGLGRGPNATAGHFDVGGASGSPEQITGISLFGGAQIFFPVRGYPESARYGRYAWAASAEYRIPLALMNWGLGAWPLHFDRITGSIFADAGNAWGPRMSAGGFQNPRREALYSVGAEVTGELLSFYRINMLVRTGAALQLAGNKKAQFYVRLGMPF